MRKAASCSPCWKPWTTPPGLVVLGGDHVNNTNSGSLASITSGIQAVYPGVQTFYTYAAHDKNVSEDSSNPYAFARTGEYYTGENYYVYAVDQDDMQSSSSAATASAEFLEWAETADSDKVIFVMCHMPIHSRRGDNAGGATWMDALNEAGASHDIVYLWGHNHTGESSTDTSVYFVNRGGELTPQGGSTGEIAFTYMNAGYIKNGYASMVVIEDDAIQVTRYSSGGSATATYTAERLFAETHNWTVTESVEPTCTEDGYTVQVCADCGETKTTVISATGHSYSAVTMDTCTGIMTTYTCDSCGHSYSELQTASTSYDLADSLEEGASYIIVYSNYALTYSSGGAAKTSVTIEDDAVTSEVTDAMLWTYEDGKLSNSSSGSAKYLYVSGSSSNRPGGSSSKTLSFSGSGSSCSYSGSKLKIGSYYLYYSNSSSAFKASSSGSTIKLYKLNEVTGGTGEHTYETVTVEPTCTENGSVTYTCTACGYSYTEVLEANGEHTYETVTVEPTCTENGSVTYTCTACGDSYTEVIEALGHEYTAVVTAPTCTEAGYTTYTCHCGDSYVADEVAAAGHVYTAVTVEATCTEDGSVTYTCVCGDSYSEVIEALGHEYTAVVTAPTCTEAGYTTYTCHCGDSYVADEIAALGHEYTAVVTAPTCTKGGYTTYICACGDSYVADETAALGHDYTAVVTAPTCTEAGYTTYTCATCGSSYVADEVAALGHEYTAVVTEPTCTEAGCTTYTCATCGSSYVADEVAALGHAYTAVVTAPTCTEAGYTTYTCATCGDSYIGDEIAALGHDYTCVSVAATCETDGSNTYTCACGDTYTEVIPAPGHSFESVVTEATCTEAGAATHTCTVCGYSYAEVIEALGHEYTAVVTAPTCTEGGYTTYTCHCGDSYVADETAALGHSYTAVESDGYMVYTCDGCGHSYSEKLTPAYSYGQVSGFTSGGQHVITLYSDGCYYALSHAGNAISTVEVTVTDGEITSEVSEDLLWNYENSKLSYEDSNGTTRYLTVSGGSGWFGWFGGSLSLSTSGSSNVSISNGRLKIGSYYLNCSNGSVSVSRWGGDDCCLFVQTEN